MKEYFFFIFVDDYSFTDFRSELRITLSYCNSLYFHYSPHPLCLPLLWYPAISSLLRSLPLYSPVVTGIKIAAPVIVFNTNCHPLCVCVCVCSQQSYS